MLAVITILELFMNIIRQEHGRFIDWKGEVIIITVIIIVL